uniref:S-arrestin n=1 Tax=Kryptolebias marmoratus TaxID=37003 RepID=A0A3Q3A6W9_KRYMA
MSPKHVVFKKVSRDKSVAVYMAKRDFVDHCDFVDPVDGVIVIDPTQLKGKKVYVMLSCTFRYGRQDMDVMGVAFRRDLFVVTRQVYPELQDKEQLTHTKIQQKLLRKLGDNAYPFFFEFPDNLPCSVSLQPGPTDEGKKCAVEFEVKAFCGENQDEKIEKQSSVRLTIRKIQFSPENTAVVPVAEMTFEFLMSEKPLHVKLSLSKEVRVDPKRQSEFLLSHRKHGLHVEGFLCLCLYVSDRDSVPSGTTLKKDYTLYPLLAYNKERRGIALDGRLKHEDTNLASSSIVKQEVLKEVQGMLVSYKVVLKMIASGMVGSSDVSLEVPFKLMHPKPEQGNDPHTCSSAPSAHLEPDDMVFEDFKRAYLKGVVYGDDDESPAEA